MGGKGIVWEKQRTCHLPRVSLLKREKWRFLTRKREKSEGDERKRAHKYAQKKVHVPNFLCIAKRVNVKRRRVGPKNMVPLGFYMEIIYFTQEGVPVNPQNFRSPFSISAYAFHNVSDEFSFKFIDCIFQLRWLDGAGNNIR